MTCPHRAVQVVRIVPQSADEAALAMSVAIDLALSTGAPVGYHNARGELRSWIVRGFCAECEDA